MSYMMAKRIHDHRKAKALAAAEKLGFDMEKANELSEKYQALYWAAEEVADREKFYRLWQWANLAILGIRSHNGEKIRF